jgi:hypothetical protein
MGKSNISPLNKKMFRVNRDTFGGTEAFTYIGEGESGGKAEGLAFIQEKIIQYFSNNPFPPVTETQFVRQVKLKSCLKVKINAKDRLGVILK